jgi:hypothetical protein
LADEKVLLGNVPSRSTLDFSAIAFSNGKKPYVVGWLWAKQSGRFAMLPVAGLHTSPKKERALSI